MEEGKLTMKELIEEKFKVLSELSINLSREDKAKIKSCHSEIELDNVAHSIIMR